MFVPHRTHLWASTTYYRDSFTFLYVDDVRTSQETPVVLHDLVQGQLYFSICRWCSYLTGDTPIGLHDLIQGQPYFSIWERSRKCFRQNLNEAVPLLQTTWSVYTHRAVRKTYCPSVSCHSHMFNRLRFDLAQIKNDSRVDWLLK
jgi:hypothetical protein